jgi:nitrate/nitrite transporter NarK
MGISTTPWIVVPAYVLYYTSYAAVQAAFWLIPSDALHGRSAAVGLAALGSIGMLGAFVGPFAWGLLKDHTGTYHAGLVSLAILSQIHLTAQKAQRGAGAALATLLPRAAEAEAFVVGLAQTRRDPARFAGKVRHMQRFPTTPAPQNPGPGC